MRSCWLHGQVARQIKVRALGRAPERRLRPTTVLAGARRQRRSIGRARRLSVHSWRSPFDAKASLFADHADSRPVNGDKGPPDSVESFHCGSKDILWPCSEPEVRQQASLSPEWMIINCARAIAWPGCLRCQRSAGLLSARHLESSLGIYLVCSSASTLNRSRLSTCIFISAQVDSN